jgi:hypothetical protein
MSDVNVKQELKTEYGVTDEEIQTIGERYDLISEHGVIMCPEPTDPDVPLPPQPQPDTKKFTNFKYKFGEHESNGKMRPRDTFYGEFGAVNIEAYFEGTVFGDPKENDQIDFKLGGGNHTDGKKESKAGQCYPVGLYFDGKPFVAKEYPKHPTTPNFSDKIQIVEGAPKSVGNVRGKKIGLMVRKYIYNNNQIKIECHINLFDGKGLQYWYYAIDDGSWVGKPFLTLNGKVNGSPELVYLRIDSILKKTEVEVMYALDLTKGSPDPEPDPDPDPEPNPDPEPKPTGDLDPKYKSLQMGHRYRMPTEGPINDGKRIDKGASKWGLQRNDDGSVHVAGSTIRLKIFAGQYLDGDQILAEMKKVNPKASYDVARQLGYWLPLPIAQWVNVEVTKVITLRKSSHKDGGFIGDVIRSCIHDLKGESDIAALVEAYHAGSSYHNNVTGNKGFQWKIEFYHVKYHEYKMVDAQNLIDKKIGVKTCLFNKGDKVRMERYVDLKNEGKGPYELKDSIEFDGTEGKGVDEGCGLITWGSPYIILKSNDSSYDLHDLEIREIDVSA